jgi:hypothetical protein
LETERREERRAVINPGNPQGPGPRPVAYPSRAGEVELAHVDQLPAASLREAGDGELTLFADEPFCAEFSVRPPTPPAVPCSCNVCAKASAPPVQRGRVPLAVCESRRLKRERNLLGVGKGLLNPRNGYRIGEIAVFLRCSPKVVESAARRLRSLRKLPGDTRYAPLTRAQTKRVIELVRSRTR